MTTLRADATALTITRDAPPSWIPTNTWHAYCADWEAWTIFVGDPFQATTLDMVRWIDAMQPDLKFATIRRRIAGVRAIYKWCERFDPGSAQLVTARMNRLRMSMRINDETQARALTTDEVVRMADACPAMTLNGARDRSLILMGYSTGARPGELVLLRVQDVTVEPTGMQVTIAPLKRSRGRVVWVPRGKRACPVLAWTSWATSADLVEGNAYRGIRYGRSLTRSIAQSTIARGVVNAAKAAGVSLDRLSSYSLRAGNITRSIEAGATVDAAQRFVDHKHPETTQRYVRGLTARAVSTVHFLGL